MKFELTFFIFKRVRLAMALHIAWHHSGVKKKHSGTVVTTYFSLKGQEASL